MQEAIGKIIDAVISLIKNNYKKPRLWIIIGIFVFCIVLLFPYIDSNVFYYSRMEKRINILEKVMELDETKINSNKVFQNEYNKILREMEQQSEMSVNSIMNNAMMYIQGAVKSEKTGNKWWKFFSGAIWFIIVTIWIPFMNTFNSRKEKVLAFIIMLILSILVGLFSLAIPIIIDPRINYFVWPLLQLIMLIILMVKYDDK